MDTSATPGNAGIPLADLPQVLRVWNEISTQASDRMTTLSRSALRTGMHFAEQNAAQAEQWLQLLEANAQRAAAIIRSAESRTEGEHGVSELWQVEAQLARETAQAATLLGQDLWKTLMQTQTALAQSAITQGNENLRHTLAAFNGNGASHASERREAAAVPPAGFGVTPLADWMTQATNAWLQAASAATQAAGRSTAARPDTAPPALRNSRSKRG